MKIRLFVYGTLQKGFFLNSYLRRFDYVGDFSLKGFKMYCNGYYPMIIKGSEEDIVKGELYECSPEVWGSVKGCLDQIEGSYFRRLVNVFKGKKVFKAYVYVWKYAVRGLQEIKSGDFRSWKDSYNAEEEQQKVEYLYEDLFRYNGEGGIK